MFTRPVSRRLSFFCGIILTVATAAFGQPAPGNAPAKGGFRVADSLTVETRHRLKLGKDALEYTARTGFLVLRQTNGRPTATMSYVAYTKNGANLSERPITFCFNGGPGSSSVWLHMGSVGPKRVVMPADGSAPAAPYQYGDNPQTWLRFTDLVFIDPVMTGYSLPAEGQDKANFTGYQNDLASVGEFVRLYCSSNQRWASPKFLAGESYGTTRASGLAAYLQDNYGMYLNGICLISAVLNFQTLSFDGGNDLAYACFLPSMAATAWYHKAAGQGTTLEQHVRAAEALVNERYIRFLFEGSQADSVGRNQLFADIARLTGLRPEYVRQAQGKVTPYVFFKELLRSQGKTTGRFDSRMIGYDNAVTSDDTEYDPSYTTVQGAFSTTLNHYLKADLGFSSHLPYEILTGKVHPWSYVPFINRYVNNVDGLRAAIVHNPGLKVWFASGYYDLATPYYATVHTMNHLNLPAHLRSNVVSTYYLGGHMMYTIQSEHEKLAADAERFYQQALKR